MLNKFIILSFVFLLISCSKAKTSLTVNDSNRYLITDEWLEKNNKSLIFIGGDFFIWKNITTKRKEDIIFSSNKYNDYNFFIATPGIYVLDYWDCHQRACKVCTNINGISNDKVSYFSFEVKKGDVFYLERISIKSKSFKRDIHLYAVPFDESQKKNLESAKKNIPKIKKEIKILKPMPGEFLQNQNSYYSPWLGSCPAIKEKLEMEKDSILAK